MDTTECCTGYNYSIKTHAPVTYVFRWFDFSSITPAISCILFTCFQDTAEFYTIYTSITPVTWIQYVTFHLNLTHFSCTCCRIQPDTALKIRTRIIFVLDDLRKVDITVHFMHATTTCLRLRCSRVVLTVDV